MTESDLDAALMLAGRSTEAPQWNRRDYEQILHASPASLVLRSGWVAENGSGLVGLAVAGWLRGEDQAEVETVLVEETCRRQGIGGALLQACMEWAGQAGAAAIRLEVRRSNAAALALYRRQGFLEVGTRRLYYSAPSEDALLLLAPATVGRKVSADQQRKLL